MRKVDKMAEIWDDMRKNELEDFFTRALSGGVLIKNTSADGSKKT